MTNGSAGSLAGAAIGVALLGIGLGVTANVVKQTSKQLKVKQPKYSSKKNRLKRMGIY